MQASGAVVREFADETVSKDRLLGSGVRRPDMTAGESATSPRIANGRAGSRRCCARQLRNIAPFLTLIFLVVFFSVASPSFATLDNLGNILTPGLDHRRSSPSASPSSSCAPRSTSRSPPSPTSPASWSPSSRCRNPTSTSPTCRCPAGLAILLALALLRPARPRHRLRRHGDRHPVLHHDAGHDADRRRHLARCWCAARSPMRCRRSITTLGSALDRRHSLDRDRRRAVPARRPPGADLHPLRPLRVHGRRQPRGGGIFRRQRQAHPRRRHGDLGRLLRHRRHAGRRLFRQRAAERVRHLPARRDRRRRGRRHQPVRRPRRHRQHHRRPVRAGRAQQRPRPRRHRQLPEDPDPRPDPARGAVINVYAQKLRERAVE